MTKIAFMAALVLTGTAQADGVLSDFRYCGEPLRDSRGVIVRRADVVRAFRKLHPCPATGKTVDPCPGWEIDHTWPLASCGCDSVTNLAWMPKAIKSAAGRLPKDRWERRIYKCLGPIDLTPMPE